jgi:hypothetical protein
MQIDTENRTAADGTPYTIFIVSIETTDEVFYLRFTAVGLPAQVISILKKKVNKERLMVLRSALTV